MRYGIISDIHGNWEALEAVLRALGQVDKYVCLGDLVGYGPNPNECVRKVRLLRAATVLGNHDAALVGKLAPLNFNDRAKKALEWTAEHIIAEDRHYLNELPELLEEPDFQLVHGSLRRHLEEYIISLKEAVPTIALMAQPLCFVGHTHSPLFIGQKEDGNYDGRHLLPDEEVIVPDYRKTLINVGSVGQPRDGDPRAAYGIYDSQTKIFSFHRVEYDIDRVQEKMRTAGLPPQLSERLAMGR